MDRNKIINIRQYGSDVCFGVDDVSTKICFIKLNDLVSNRGSGNLWYLLRENPSNRHLNYSLLIKDLRKLTENIFDLKSRTYINHTNNTRKYLLKFLERQKYPEEFLIPLFNVIFPILRCIDSEFFSIWDSLYKDFKVENLTDMIKYFHTSRLVSSGHVVNENLSLIFNTIEDDSTRNTTASSFINTIQSACENYNPSKDKKYIKIFKEESKKYKKSIPPGYYNKDFYKYIGQTLSFRLLELFKNVK